VDQSVGFDPHWSLLIMEKRDEVPIFLTLPSESLISRNPSKREPTREEAMESFISAARELADTIKKLVARSEMDK
jgi:hypothetical protein